MAGTECVVGAANASAPEGSSKSKLAQGRDTTGGDACAATSTCPPAGKRGVPPSAEARSGAETGGGGTWHELARSGGHPLGIKPLGNLLAASRDAQRAAAACRARGLGDLSRLKDERVADIVSFLDPPALTALAAASRAAYGFTSVDDVWKPLVLDDLRGDFEFVRSWKHTMLVARYRRRRATGSAGRCPAEDPGYTVVTAAGLFSDVLFQPWFAGSRALDASWLAVDNVPRVSADISQADFAARFDRPNLPVVITGVVPTWSAFRSWTVESLTRRCVGDSFRCGPVEMTLDAYAKYAARQSDDRPLYLFSKVFPAQLADDYAPPECLGEDLFALLGDDRPAHRWLIVGPARSGSSFHVDPNATSAWNGIVKGSKKWLLFPPGTPPPGVLPSPDGAEVATPPSITEWFMNFYRQAAAAARTARARGGAGPFPMECTLREGELMFVPSGWWHLVVNLEDTIAITQNFCTKATLPRVRRFLREKREQVSGVASPETLHERFDAAVEAAHPGLIAAQEAEEEAAARERTRAGGASRYARVMASARASQGEAAPTGGGSGGGVFTFGFGRK